MRSSPAIALAFLLAGSPAAADDFRLLAEAASGIVPVNDEKSIQVRGLEGQVILQSGVKGEVEFQSTSMQKDGEEIPLALWTDGHEFRLDTPSGRTSARTRLRVMIPPGMHARLDVENAVVHTDALGSELTLHGSHVRLEASGLLRRAEVEVDDGTVNVQGAAEGLTIRGRELETILDGITGPTELRLNGGSAKLTSLLSGLKAEFIRTRVGINTITGPVDLRFQEGKAKVEGLRDGGQIAVTGCRLELAQVAGDLAVTSDSDVAFTNSRASLHIENTSGGVAGLGNDGVVEITTHRAQVNLAQINGQLRIGGDELEIKLKDIGAALNVSTQSSNLTVEGCSSATIENDRGLIVVKRSESLISVKTQGGEIHLLDMRGSVAIEAAADHVEVEWTSMPADRDSRIDNDGGDVTVRFPMGDCRVNATSMFGRVDSNLSGVRSLKSDKTAQGVLGAGGARTVVVKASGDVYLVGPDAPEQSGQSP